MKKSIENNSIIVLFGTILMLATAPMQAMDTTIDYTLVANPIAPNITTPDKQQMFIAACSTGNLALVKRLLGSNKVSINAMMIDGQFANRPALFIATERGHLPVVRALLHAGADVNAAITMEEEAGVTPLIVACHAGYFEIVQVLLAAGANVDAAITMEEDAGVTSLSVASQEGHLEIVQELIAAGANVNAAITSGYYNGDTPLHKASQSGHLEVVKVLLAADANVNAFNDNGETPLHVASEVDNLAMVQVLLAAGANVNAVITYGHYAGLTPLYIASQEQHTLVVETLITYGADPLKIDLTQGAYANDCYNAIKKARVVWKHGPSLCEYSNTENAYIPRQLNIDQLNLTDLDRAEIAEIYGENTEQLRAIAQDFLAITNNVSELVVADHKKNYSRHVTIQTLTARKYLNPRAQNPQEADIGSLQKLPKEVLLEIGKFMVRPSNIIVAPQLVPYIKPLPDDTSMAHKTAINDSHNLKQELSYKKLLQSSRMIAWLEARNNLVDPKNGALILHPTESH